MRVSVLGPILLWTLGLASIVWALRSGGASAALVLIFPVVYGGSLWLALGSLLIFAGFIAMAFVWPGEPMETTARPLSGPRPPGSRSSATDAGGVILVGPFPILFGSWKGDRKLYRRWAVVGLALTAVLVLALLWLG